MPGCVAYMLIAFTLLVVLIKRYALRGCFFQVLVQMGQKR